MELSLADLEAGMGKVYKFSFLRVTPDPIGIASASRFLRVTPDAIGIASASRFLREEKVKLCFGRLLVY